MDETHEHTCWPASVTSCGGISSVPISRMNVLAFLDTLSISEMFCLIDWNKSILPKNHRENTQYNNYDCSKYFMQNKQENYYVTIPFPTKIEHCRQVCHI